MEDSSCKPSENRRLESRRLDDFLADWFEQPGNYARYARANGKPGRERRGDVGDEIYKAYSAVGGTQQNRTVKFRIWKWVQQFCKARHLACNGATKALVRKECRYYYRMVERLGDDINIPIDYQNPSRSPAGVEMDNTQKKATQQQLNDDHCQDMMRMLNEMAQRQRRQHEQVMHLLDQRQELLNRQSERARLMEMQIEASMILSVSDRLRNVGFTEDEIALHIQLLQPLHNFHTQMNANVDPQQQS